MFGMKLEDWRQRAMISPKGLAAQVGCSSEYIRLIERGQRVPSPEMAAKLGAACGIRPAEIEEALKLVGSERTVRHLGQPLQSYPHVDDVIAAFNAHMRPIMLQEGYYAEDVDEFLREAGERLRSLLR